MFEYWFHGLDDGNGTFTHHGTTFDFLEVVSQMALLYNARITGDFVRALLVEHDQKLSFLRVTEWKFEHSITPDKKIVLQKLPR